METRNAVSDTKKSSVACEILLPRWRIHLLAVEEDDKFDGVDERKQGAKESPRPNHSLTVDQHQNVGGNDKLLSSQLLHQRIGRVVYHHPDTHTHRQTRHSHKTTHLPLHISRRMFCWRGGVYLRGNSTSTSVAMVMSRSNTVSLYISCPMRVSQHWTRTRRWAGLWHRHCQRRCPSNDFD